MSQTDESRAVVESLWDALYQRDFERVGTLFADDAHYEDVPAPDDGARGPENIVKRLKIGLEPIERQEHHLHRMVAEGNKVMTEHTEDWHWGTGETVSLPFVSVHEVENGKITVWRDYWDLSTLMSGAPQWWLEHLAKFTADDFS